MEAVMSKCLKCGASDDWLCIDKIDTNMGYSESVESSGCLRRQLAAVTAERDELKRKMAECREAWPHIVVAHLMDTNDDEIAAEATLNRHLGGE
jgi:hypothetical protein